MPDSTVRMIAQDVHGRADASANRLARASDMRGIQDELREVVDLVRLLAQAVRELDRPAGPPTPLRAI